MQSQHVPQTKRPLVLTVNGKIAAMVQDADAYWWLLDLAAEVSAAEGIRQGLEDVASGRGRLAREVLDQIRAEYHMPRRTYRAGYAKVLPQLRRLRRINESNACHAQLQAGHPVTIGFDTVLQQQRRELLDRPVKPAMTLIWKQLFFVMS